MSGADTYYFPPGHGNDTIGSIFHSDQGDRIDLSALGANAPTWAQLQAAATDSAIQWLTDDGGVVFDLSAFGGGTIRLAANRLDDLSADDFIGLAAGTGPATPPSTPSSVAPPAPTIPIPVAIASPSTIERGGSGNNTINGSAGADNIYGEAGNDALLGGAGADYINGGAGSDHIWGQSGNDGILGGTGEDLIFGLAGDDTISGGADRDIILGGDGDDQIRSDNGYDGVWAEGGDDTVHGGADGDFLAGGTGDDSLYGGGGGDYLAGEAGNDTLDGGAGFGDVLAGGPGNDILYGDAVGNTSFGQAGADTFIISTGFSGTSHWIMDFESADRLDIGMNLSQVQAASTQLGYDLGINLPGGGNLYMANTTIWDIGADNLI